MSGRPSKIVAVTEQTEILVRNITEPKRMSEKTAPATLAAERTALTVGSGAGLAGVFAFLAVLSASVANQPVVPAGVVAAAVGVLVGAVAGARVVSVESVRWLLASKRRTLLSWLPLAGALVVVTVVGIGEVMTGSGATFWAGLAAVALMTVGWVGVIQAGQDSESTAAMERTTTVIALPETGLFDNLVPSRWLRPLQIVFAGCLFAGAGVMIWQAEFVSLLFLAPGLFLFAPGIKLQPYIVDDGLVFENYVGSRIALGATFASWEELPDYRIEDGRLVIERDVGSAFEFDRAEIEEFDRVVEILDEHIGE